MEAAGNPTHREPWNKAKIVGQKAPFKPKDRVVGQEIDGGRLRRRQVGVDLRIHRSNLVDCAVQSRLNAPA